MPMPPRQVRRGNTIESYIGGAPENETQWPAPVAPPIDPAQAAAVAAAVAGQAQPAGGGAALPAVPLDPSMMPTPQIRPGSGGPDTDPSVMPITTEEVMQDGNGTNTAALIAAGAGGAALGAGLMWLKQRMRPYDGLSGRNLRSAEQHNQQLIGQAVSEGRITPDQARQLAVEGPASPLLIEDMRDQTFSGGERQRGPNNNAAQAPETGQTGNRRAAPVVEGAAEAASQGTARPQAGSAPQTAPEAPRTQTDPATDAISTEDVVPQTQRNIDTSQLPPGTRVVDQNPTHEGRYISAGASADGAIPAGSVINLDTKELVAPVGDGRWIIIPAGSSHESVRRQVLGQALRAVRGAL